MGGKEFFSFSEWLLDIALRWQFLNIVGVVILYSIELGTAAAAIGYLVVARNLA